MLSKSVTIAIAVPSALVSVAISDPSYYTSNDHWIQDGPVGDQVKKGDDAWSDHDLHANAGDITAIQLNKYFAWSCCWLITAIRTRYGDVWSDWHGQIRNFSGNWDLETFVFNQGTRIETVKVGAGQAIDWIEFRSSDNVTYGPYGDESMKGGSPYHFSHWNCQLAYFSGTTDDLLDSLTFHSNCGMNYFHNLSSATRLEPLFGLLP